MPEGPEVRKLVDMLNKLTNKTIKDITILVGNIVKRI